MSKTFLSCTEKLLVAQFEVTVDSLGHILSSNRTTEFAMDTSLYFNADAVAPAKFESYGVTHTELDLWNQSTALIATTDNLDFRWHNDSTTSDWF